MKWREAITTAASQPAIMRIKHVMSTRKMFGFPKNQESFSDDFTSVVNDNPTSQWHWLIRISQPYISEASTYRMRVWITYGVEFYDRRMEQPNNYGSFL